MNVIHDPPPLAGAGDLALVMLPGAGDCAQDLVDQGFLGALRRRGVAADAWMADVPFDQYMDGSFAAQLERDVLAPIRGMGHRRTWMMGISLGGMAALSVARRHPGAIEGLILLAPFLGTRGRIAEVAAAGGLRKWLPGAVPPDDDELQVLSWLRDYQAGDPALPRIHLGYGTDDRYAPASELLARELPGAQVVSAEGEHDWATWLSLWERLLDAGVLRAPSAAADSK
jgi:pimeloyl-ACP methyl ester carboxylesterase